jgi:squalene-associated FAD-dependent desaturase
MVVTADNNSSIGRVLIVGGGLAGLSAAALLASHGVPSTIVESRRQLGGRATSFQDPTTGEWVDNCQHVTMGCCTYLADFCRRTDIARMLQQHRSLAFMDEDGRVSRIAPAPLPAPLHLAPSLLAASFLSLPDKLRVARGTWALFRNCEPDDPQQPFDDWLRRRGQTRATLDRYWGLILTSALNETLDRVDFHHARKVFLDGFLSSRSAFYLEIPNVPLGTLYGSALQDWLARHDVELRLNTAVSHLLHDGAYFSGAQLRSGETLAAPAVILAVPFHRVGDLIPESLRSSWAGLENLNRIESSPITSVHFWYDRPIMTEPHLVIVGRQTQWLFRRPGSGEDGYIQAVISASRDLASLGNDAIERRIREEVEQILPAAREATLRHVRVVTERRATFSVQPGIDRLRPTTTTNLPGLFLAGDFTQTGRPATMEGAVISGNQAAQAILRERALDAPNPAPLSRSWIARWLTKIPTHVAAPKGASACHPHP